MYLATSYTGPVSRFFQIVMWKYVIPLEKIDKMRKKIFQYISQLWWNFKRWSQFILIFQNHTHLSFSAFWSESTDFFYQIHINYHVLRNQRLNVYATPFYLPIEIFINIRWRNLWTLPFQIDITQKVFGIDQ